MKSLLVKGQLSLALVVFISTGAFGFFYFSQAYYQQIFSNLCEMVATKVYLTGVRVHNWKSDCLKKSERVSLTSRSDVVRVMNEQMEWLGVSHLRIVSPQEAIETWEPEAVSQSKEPLYSLVEKDWGYLSLRSFLPQYFEQAQWSELVDRAEPVKNLIIDLRQNQGGNFVAMLRVLSSLICKPATRIGRLERPKTQNSQRVVFEDLLEDADQLKTLETFRYAEMHTFSGYPCFQFERMIVLTDYQTASVSEIMTFALKHHGALHFGDRTAGSVLVGVWYPLHQLGKGYWISLPEAYFTSFDGSFIEGEGVWSDFDINLNQESIKDLIYQIKSYF